MIWWYCFRLCCECGTLIEPNPSNMCVPCLRTKVDITEGIPKQATLQFCRNCDRYLQPPSEWMHAPLESRELLSLCLNKLKSLNRVKLVDAGFIWTEPHSKRLKVSKLFFEYKFLWQLWYKITLFFFSCISGETHGSRGGRWRSSVGASIRCRLHSCTSNVRRLSQDWGKGLLACYGELFLINIFI